VRNHRAASAADRRAFAGWPGLRTGGRRQRVPRRGLRNLGELVENEGGIDRGVALARDRIEGVATPIIVKRPLELTLLPRGLPKPLVDCTGKAEGLLVHRVLKIVALGEHVQGSLERLKHGQVSVLIGAERPLLGDLEPQR
jgi:hypothetical protein